MIANKITVKNHKKSQESPNENNEKVFPVTAKEQPPTKSIT